MPPADILVAPYPELVAQAIQAIENRDLNSLQDLDAAFHYRFQVEAREGTEESRTKLIQALLAILDSKPARQQPRPDEVLAVLVRWEQLDQLTATLREEYDLAGEARRLVDARKHGWNLLRRLAVGQVSGTSAGELAEQLEISPQQLSPLVAEFEALDLVDRHRSGGRTYIRLGLTGHALLEQPVAQLKWTVDFRNISAALDCRPEKLM
jgi:DNA-binding transcriptional ArsR family regulator